MSEKYIAPQFASSGFHCPYCGVYADQEWSLAMASGHRNVRLKDVKAFYLDDMNDIVFSKCSHCRRICIWRDEHLISPRKFFVSEPNEDLPEDIKMDYLEAASILQDSPRGAAALLRLCIQKLCKELGQKGKNLNADIGKLVKNGLPADIRKAMDLLRVTGDNAVHPGVIDLNDSPENAAKLFDLVNFVAEKMISEPRRLNAFYDEMMPQSAKDAITKRDNEPK